MAQVLPNMLRSPENHLYHRFYQTCSVCQEITCTTGLTKLVTFARKSFVSKVLPNLLRSPGNHSYHKSYQTCCVHQGIIRITSLTKHVTFARQSFLSEVLLNMLRSPGNHSCNGSAPHSVDEGDSVTYTCSFVYRGVRVQPIEWDGPGATADSEVSNVTRSPEEVSRNCYTGRQPLAYNFHC